MATKSDREEKNCKEAEAIAETINQKENAHQVENSYESALQVTTAKGEKSRTSHHTKTLETSW